MRIPLRVSVALLVAVINVAVFGAGLAWLTDEIAGQRREVEEAYAKLLTERLQQLLDSRGNLKASGILRWSYWNRFEDAIIVHLPGFRDGRAPEGARQQLGVYLNPVGSAQRTWRFDEAAVLDDIRSAARDGREVSSARGVAVPVFSPSGEVWGGCWFLPKWNWNTRALFRELLPWFLVSTLLLTVGTFAALRHLVLHPVRLLARGARRVAGGDLSVRVPETRRGDEVSELMRAFNTMTGQVQGFSEQLAREVERATAKARNAEAAAMTQRRLAATGELAAGIAHEINNPLGGMLNAIEVLQRADLPPDKRARYQELLRSGLERIRETVGQVLRLAPRETCTEPVSLAGPIRDAIGLVRHRAEQLGVRIELASGERRVDADGRDAGALFEGLPPVSGQGSELGQAVLNLLVNALDALESPRSSDLDRHILIRLEEEGGELRLSVEDNGPGLERELLQRAPDLFFTTKATGRGTGLGLAIVHNVVSGHGGRVLLSSEPGQGFRADIFLPICDDKEAGS